jgi:hypothetical protein
MNPRRLPTVPTPLLVSVSLSVIFMTGIVGLLAASGPEGIPHTGAAPRTDASTLSYSHKLELAGAPRQIHVAAAVLPGALADASIALNIPKPVVDTVSINSRDVPPTKPAPVQVASANPMDFELGNANKAVTSIEIIDECFVVDICVDRYLWALYQRTPKEDTIKKREWRNVTVKRKVKGKRKTVTVARAFTRLVDEDFGWKDPKAAERAGMSMMDYVIGGMDRSFKLKLYHMFHAAEAAGLTPGITSAFRDDYRQSIASGLKAASNKSYHGGSSRGGYGHGLAADIVGVQGRTRDQRWASSEKLWKWVDAHGKEFGIGRPYLGRDPPHVAPIDGKEYAKHNRGIKQARSDAKKKVSVKQARSNVKKAKRAATRDVLHLAKRPRTAVAQR